MCSHQSWKSSLLYCRYEPTFLPVATCVEEDWKLAAVGFCALAIHSMLRVMHDEQSPRNAPSCPLRPKTYNTLKDKRDELRCGVLPLLFLCIALLTVPTL